MPRAYLFRASGDDHHRLDPGAWHARSGPRGDTPGGGRKFKRSVDDLPPSPPSDISAIQFAQGQNGIPKWLLGTTAVPLRGHASRRRRVQAVRRICGPRGRPRGRCCGSCRRSSGPTTSCRLRVYAGSRMKCRRCDRRCSSRALSFSDRSSRRAVSSSAPSRSCIRSARRASPRRRGR